MNYVFQTLTFSQVERLTLKQLHTYIKQSYFSLVLKKKKKIELLITITMLYTKKRTSLFLLKKNI